MLCLNMIVKNESARILRALDAALPFITTFAILDTGSIDDTPAIIRAWALEHNIQGVVGEGAFANFSQARNQALDLARDWRQQKPDFKYLLLQDADMELVGTGLSVSHLDGECYEMTQTGGAVSYTNTRLLSVWSGARYVGRTHEYLDAAPTGLIQGVHFVDHADGANRADKFERDVVLLKKDIAEDPKNPRSWFYLGNTYRDLGKWKEAEDAFRKRIEIGGWDEETYVAMCNVAVCRLGQSDSAGYIAETLRAYEFRPCRAEPLYDLAKHFREKGNNHTAMLFAEKGISMPKPDDRLFVNDFVYSHGFREEFSIAGYYTDRREQAMKITNGLALDLKNQHSRNLARSNMVHYLQPLDKMAPSTRHSRLSIESRLPHGYAAMNPSICAAPSGSLECIVRAVNYKINEHGQYMIGEKGCQEAPIVTQNSLIRLDDDLNIVEHVPISWLRPPPKFDLVIGLEDMRLFWKKGERHFVACVREQSEYGNCEQWEGKLLRRFGSPTIAAVEDAQHISAGFTTTEKNWMPILYKEQHHYVYRLNTLVKAGEGMSVTAFPREVSVDNISGSSPWLSFAGGMLSVVHEAICHPATGKRIYQHRLAWTSPGFNDLRLSLPFTFQDTQIEFCAGLALHPDRTRFVMSYGLRDTEAWLATISVVDVMAMLRL